MHSISIEVDQFLCHLAKLISCVTTITVFYVLGTRAYDQLCTLIATLLVLRLLVINFPSQYEIKFTGRLTVLSSPSQYKAAVTRAVEGCRNILNQQPTAISSLELGYSVEDAIDSIIEKCA